MTFTPQRGLGTAPAGSSYAGFGLPATTTPPTSIPFQKADGTQGTSRAIDAATRDYVLDLTTGRVLGMDAVQQLVLLALTTVKGSSAVASLGQEISTIRTITDSTTALITLRVSEALASLIAQRKVSLDSVSVERTQDSRIEIEVRWTDLTKNKPNVTTI